MSNINHKNKNLFAIDAVQDLDNETAATCSGGLGYLLGPDPDVVLYKDPNLQGQSLGVNAATGDGVPNIGFINGTGGTQETTFNDQVSSIRINRGTWQFFADALDNQNLRNSGGDVTAPLGPGVYNLGHNNDRITSVFRVGA